MSAFVLCTALLAAPPAVAPQPVDVFLERVELTAWPGTTGQSRDRIERDDRGHVVRLWLDGVTLEPGDLELVCQMSHLQRLSLSETNVTDLQLYQLAALKELRGLRLNSTAVSDEGIRALANCRHLKSLCLGNVRVTRAAVDELKSGSKRLAVGYSQRRD